MDEATRRRVTERQEAGPVLPKHGGNPSREWPPEGWPRDGWPPAGWRSAEGGGTNWLPEEYYNAALWESS
jgi:hypothetical protein